MAIDVDYNYLKTMTSSSDHKAIVVDLMTTYGEDVWNYAFSIVRKREQADDITQEVFLKVFRNLFTFRSEASVKTWLLTITRNAAFDYRRSAFLRRVTLVDTIRTSARTASAEQETMDKLTIDDIWEQVLQLPAKYREVLILFGHHQLSMKEMADVLGIREGTVRSRLHHARMKMLKQQERERLEP
ncbi:MAG: sigma-70 family RNA polymerase sigma factor [Paenibacillaceae bacterium]|uniref:RNA polymerase sigma factor n=1 Tax=Paenibacillus cymbidii TaxID=1639034 RepID=UPI001081F3C5|nr:sigma-70 family RNA polymerase sigma factor [Paenibacillus cymbidii]MBO9609924.1 sigma-70 family RNA polymerase sigma factor [Paenibacillaceae bacterium]